MARVTSIPENKVLVRKEKKHQSSHLSTTRKAIRENEKKLTRWDLSSYLEPPREED